MSKIFLNTIAKLQEENAALKANLKKAIDIAERQMVKNAELVTIARTLGAQIEASKLELSKFN